MMIVLNHVDTLLSSRDVASTELHQILQNSDQYLDALSTKVDSTL